MLVRVPVVKGVALLDWAHMEDLAALNAPNFYGWGEYCGALPNCTNMVRSWQLPAACYPQLLVGNEPVNPEPAGYPITPTLAASRTVAIAAACPNTQLIVANIHINNGNGVADRAWLAAYYASYMALTGHELGALAHTNGLKDAAGLHCYAPYANQCINQINAAIALANYHGQFWLTEWHVYGDQYGIGNGNAFANFLNWLRNAPRIDRSYIWTNRKSPDLLNLVKDDGTLTKQGKQYRDWIP